MNLRKKSWLSRTKLGGVSRAEGLLALVTKEGVTEMKPNSTVLRSRSWIIFASLLATLLLVSAAIHAQTLVQTIDLKQSNSSAALTSIVIDPGINTLYVADGATTNVYLIDTA